MALFGVPGGPLIGYLKGYALCRQPLLTSRECHLGASVLPSLTFWEPFWHLGSSLGGHFGVSGAP